MAARFLFAKSEAQMYNTTLLIDPETLDLSFTQQGELSLIHGNETTAQCVRLTLLATLGTFFLDETHGTEWGRILGRKLSEFETDEAEGVLREGILQEADVRFVDELTCAEQGRALDIQFDGTLVDGSRISVEVVRGAV